MKLENFSNYREVNGIRFVDFERVYLFGLIRRPDTAFKYGFTWYLLSDGEKVPFDSRIDAQVDLLKGGFK